jgi:hypothetical protein
VQPAQYSDWVARRRALALPGYETFADVGLDGDWTTPYHIASASLTGPVLLTYNYLDAPSARLYQAELARAGYLAAMPFNRVLDRALSMAGLTRADLYVTHAFHMLPRTRSEAVPARAIDVSFDAVGRYECADRAVIALGEAAARVCRRHGIDHIAVAHPSARGLSHLAKATSLADALSALPSTR